MGWHAVQIDPLIFNTVIHMKYIEFVLKKIYIKGVKY